ncbi:hypothetical protein PHYBLDRAFT_162257 [Phycomyces blakesleeanus NRRL 1555(-)]|uniref:Uncharacterized protein n=1 Tax=Phycomyces blakesleeanus (strain ATCC 8743b / DSM 1359 / FGSC 10004 / NBRC 33097 / NRRL 1555) TaxID=763407 RepID=A0A163EKV1_PHYB8|nr:hypothetical protein PHYBLDRAFT_162257 [Phycomyces blakesleeanus NRRL 1555(-)]OAD79180.1 hypothetical protein PHYBLDRAFT_162257 [Phycomyces blakesleeanus NRRL 1555(-)]|eukprot:XP_018297220.1 hypothetical protein PHYBLDRAFT_162257 [Phycomyces blakesleeanus NRRL 1555(-)]
MSLNSFLIILWIHKAKGFDYRWLKRTKEKERLPIHSECCSKVSDKVLVLSYMQLNSDSLAQKSYADLDRPRPSLEPQTFLIGSISGVVKHIKGWEASCLVILKAHAETYSIRLLLHVALRKMAFKGSRVIIMYNILRNEQIPQILAFIVGAFTQSPVEGVV